MTTDAQNEANRRNAKKSTGPRSQAGKAVASQNALKHGLTAKRVIIPGEEACRTPAARACCTVHLRQASDNP